MRGSATTSLLLLAPIVSARRPMPLGIPEADAAFTQPQLESAVAVAGRLTRLHRVLARLEAGEPIMFGVLGGSISAGSTLGVHLRRGRWLWHGRLFEWLNATWPHAAHRRFNGAVPASTPSYVDGCLDFHLPKSVDLVFIECAPATRKRVRACAACARLIAYIIGGARACAHKNEGLWMFAWCLAWCLA